MEGGGSWGGLVGRGEGSSWSESAARLTSVTKKVLVVPRAVYNFRNLSKEPMARPGWGEGKLYTRYGGDPSYSSGGERKRKVNTLQRYRGLIMTTTTGRRN